ncbi:MAG TPA: hypothetical protein VGT44_17380 [Ktedonobacteraceae bacterium]|nr:hypothetical protein [Ktedonobacteraceae bacterium]
MSLSTSTTTQSSTRTSSTRGLRWTTAITLILLAAQFLIGMLVNLFVTVPAVHPGRDAPEYFSGVAQGIFWALLNSPLYLLLHVVVGLVLFLLSIVLLVMSIVARRAGWIVASILGFIGIMGAGFNGASFMNYNHDFSSLLMAIGFLLAAVSYVIALLRS